MDGILALDKAWGWTSHDVVARVRRLAGQRRIGHAGTLDPRATGVLLLCLGRATRLSEALMAGDKWYLARVVLGAYSSTDDGEGQLTEVSGAPAVTPQDLTRALRGQIGAVAQVPPRFAAIKHQGIPAYRQARAGRDPQMAPRQVTIHALVLLALASRREGEAPVLAWPHADLLVNCSKGTYIRAIARDLGAALGCGGYLAGLRRLASGGITLRHCASVAALEQLVADGGPAALAARLLPPDQAVASRPAALLGPALASRAVAGSSVSLPPAASDTLRLYDDSGRLLALARPLPGGGWHPDLVLAGEQTP